MPRPRIPIDLDHAARLRGEGKTLKEIAEGLNVPVGRVWGAHRAGLIDLGPRIPRGQKFTFDNAEILRRHEAGESVLALARSYDVARDVIFQRILDAGGVPRGRSEADKVRMNREGEEGRQRLTHAAHKARRESKATLQEVLKRANARSTMKGHGEEELETELRKRGYFPEPQWPCGRYNIDIALGPIAVELLNLPTGYFRDPKTPHRMKYLRDNGYCVILVLFKGREVLVENLDDVIAFIEKAYRSPSLRRKHWMIRCGCERFARGRNNLGQITAVKVPVRFFNSISEWDSG